MIHLGPRESAALGVAAISTAALADIVLTYWKAPPAVARAATRLKSVMQRPLRTVPTADDHGLLIGSQMSQQAPADDDLVRCPRCRQAGRVCHHDVA